MLQIVTRQPESDKPMIESSPLYRIRHVSEPRWYWSASGIWGLKPNARIYTARERNVEPLPMDVGREIGLWEVIADGAELGTAGLSSRADGPPPSDRIGPSALRRPLERSIVAQTITKYLWTQHCHEEGLTVVPRLEDVPAKESAPFIKAGEFITNLTLSPERFETALMAAADVICMNGAPSADALTIFDASKRMQQHYYHLAVSAFHAIEENLKEVPPDWHYRDALCRELDGLMPKETPCAK